MNPLLLAIFKFCSTNRLFKYFKQRYSSSQVGDLNNIVKLKGKLRGLFLSRNFLNDCLQKRVVPTSVSNRIRNSKARPSPTIERAFLYDDIGKLTSRLASVRKTYRWMWKRVTGFLSFFDKIRLCRYLSNLDNTVIARTRERNEYKVNRLVRNRFGNANLRPDHIITNLSSYELSSTEKSVLSVGLDFCVPNNNVSTEEVFAEFESLLAQLEKLKPVSDDKRSALRAQLNHYAHVVCGTNIDPGDKAMYREHIKVIKALRENKDLIITKPDKGAGVVLLNRCDYVDKMGIILDDANAFVKLGPASTHDNTSKNELKLRTFLLNLGKKGSLPPNVYNRVRPTGSQRPRMYGLPKIHKQGVPLRPILSMVGSAQHELSRWLCEVLEPVRTEYSSFCAKDSFSFAQSIQQFTDMPDDCYMSSFDIASLFTHVPLDETIGICADFLFDPDRPTPSFNREEFVELMNWATRGVEFSFEDEMYRQIDGVAMGSPLGPILANIFVGYQETKLFAPASSPHQVHTPLFYTRYVDDTFAIFASSEAFEQFSLRLNDLHPALRFTHETELNNQLPFLDILVHRTSNGFETSVFRKATFSGLYTQWNSFCSSSRKINLIKTLVHRAVKICSQTHLPGELEFLKNMFMENGYPEHVIQACITQKLASMSSEPKYGPKGCPVYLRLPWMGEPSTIMQKQVKSAIHQTYMAAEVRIIHKTRMLAPSTQKDVLPSQKTNNVIYMFKCRCAAGYVGRTSQRLEDRIKQHVPPNLLRRNQSDNGAETATYTSAIAQHLASSPTCLTAYSTQWFSILHKARSSTQLHVLEALYIRKHKPQLCKQKALVYRLILQN